MKICIIGHTEKNYLPYMEKYINFFKLSNIDYDVICWNRENTLIQKLPNEYYYDEVLEEGAFNKVFAYLRFRRFVQKLVKKNNYDKIIVLTTVPAVFLYRLLTKKYDGRYLFDFRDYSFEGIKPYKRLVDNLIEHSALTTISSHGFMDFLAENKKIIANHNIPLSFPNGKAVDLKDRQVLNVGYLGVVRYYEENASLLLALKNTFRYQLWYIGKATPTCNLQEFCEENEITNVSFVQKYDNAQKAELYKNIDIVNSIYGNSSFEVTTLLPNRLYEACILKKPILASKGTFLGELVERYNLGLVVDVDNDDVLTMLNDYVETYNKESFSQNCDEFLSDVEKDEAVFLRALKNFVKPSLTKKEAKKLKNI